MVYQRLTVLQQQENSPPPFVFVCRVHLGVNIGKKQQEEEEEEEEEEEQEEEEERAQLLFFPSTKRMKPTPPSLPPFPPPLPLPPPILSISGLPDLDGEVNLLERYR